MPLSSDLVKVNPDSLEDIVNNYEEMVCFWPSPESSQ
jgi:hypothetical protein